MGCTKTGHGPYLPSRLFVNSCPRISLNSKMWKKPKLKQHEKIGKTRIITEKQQN